MYDYDGIERRLLALSGLVSRVLPGVAPWFDEYVDVGEYGLAVEIVAEVIALGQADPDARALAASLLPDAEGMGLGDATVRSLKAMMREDGTPVSDCLGVSGARG